MNTINPQRCYCDECQRLDKLPVRKQGWPNCYQMLLPTAAPRPELLESRAYTLVEITPVSEVELAHFRTVDEATDWIDLNRGPEHRQGRLILWDNTLDIRVSIDAPSKHQPIYTDLPLFGGDQPQLF